MVCYLEDELMAEIRNVGEVRHIQKCGLVFLHQA